MAVVSLPAGALIPAKRLLNRAVTLPNSRVLQQEAARVIDQDIRANAGEYPADVVRPKTRSECVGGHRPCPWVSCAHHLYLDVNPRTGAMKIHRPDLEPDELAETCVLDVADAGGLTLEDIAALRGITRERVRQVQEIGLAMMGEAGVELGLPDERTSYDSPKGPRPGCP
jgi:hypothetical protein